MTTKTADSLIVDLRPFRDAVQLAVRRGRLTRDLLVKEGCDQARINREENEVEKDLRDLRIRTTTAFQDCLSSIIRDNSGG